MEEQTHEAQQQQEPQEREERERTVPYSRFEEVNRERREFKKQLDEYKAHAQTRISELEEKLLSYTREIDNLKPVALQALKYRVALEYNLPVELAERLQGKDEDELREDAQKLRKYARAGAFTSVTDAASGDAPKRIYTRQEISNPDFYKQHRDDILRAMVEGRIR